MFYDIKNKSLKADDIFYKDTTIQTDEGEFKAQDIYFLNACSDELLKELGFTRVSEDEKPVFDEKTEELHQSEFYDKKNNLYLIKYEVKQKSLEELKALKLEELKAIKEEKLLFMPFKDTIFQIDSEAKINISGKVSEIMLAQLSKTPLKSISWLDKDNQIIIFSADEFLEFAKNIAFYTESIVFKHNELRTLINEASSFKKLNLIKWGD